MSRFQHFSFIIISWSSSTICGCRPQALISLTGKSSTVSLWLMVPPWCSDIPRGRRRLVSSRGSTPSRDKDSSGSWGFPFFYPVFLCQHNKHLEEISHLLLISSLSLFISPLHKVCSMVRNVGRKEGRS